MSADQLLDFGIHAKRTLHHVESFSTCENW